MKKIYIVLILLGIAVCGAVYGSTTDYNLLNRLKGRILLQVEKNGEAFYVNPTDSNLYYLKDGQACYEVMRKLSLGISNIDLALLPLSATSADPDNTAPSPTNCPTITQTTCPVIPISQTYPVCQTCPVCATCSAPQTYSDNDYLTLKAQYDTLLNKSTAEVSPTPLTATCFVSPNPNYQGQSTNLTAQATGGNGTYLYSWSGNNLIRVNSCGTTTSPTCSTENCYGLLAWCDKTSPFAAENIPWSNDGGHLGSVSLTVTSGSQSITIQCPELILSR